MACASTAMTSNLPTGSPRAAMDEVVRPAGPRRIMNAA
jgi:hypothetical protein